MSKPHLLIVGAGIGGTVAALALVQRGFSVSVYEQATELRELGAGLQVTPNGSRVLCALGLGQQIEAIATVPTSRTIRLFSTGQTWPLPSPVAFDSPFWPLHRGDLHKTLVTALEQRSPGAVHTTSRCAGFVQDEDGVTLHLEDGRQVRGDALIGADGVHSCIREVSFGTERTAFTGFLAWRALVRMKRLPARLRQPCFTGWAGADGHVVTYPLRQGELLNFVGVIKRDDWLIESWSEAGTVPECLRDFAGWHEDVLTVVDAADIPYKWALLGRQPLPRWTVGRVSLLGDACHPMLPFLAQGANTAIEDGMVLARCVEGSTDLAAALRRYEAARLHRTSQIVRSSETFPRLINPKLADPERSENCDGHCR